MQNSVPWYRQKRFKVAAAVVVAVALLAATVSVALFTVFQNSSEKVLLDAANHVLKTPGTYKVTSGGTDMTVAYDGTRFKADTMISGSSVSIINSGNVLYFKSSDPAKLLDLIGGQGVSAAMQSTLQSIMPSLKDKWIRLDGQNKSFKLPYIDDINCATDSAKKLSDDTTDWQRVAGVYMKQPFLIIDKKTETDASVTYDVSLDQNKFDAFRNSKEMATYVDSITSCQTGKMPLDLLATSQTSQATVEIEKDDRSLKKMTLKDSTGKQTQVTTDYGTVAEIKTPNGAMGIEQVMNLLAQSFFQRR